MFSLALVFDFARLDIPRASRINNGGRAAAGRLLAPRNWRVLHSLLLSQGHQASSDRVIWRIRINECETQGEDHRAWALCAAESRHQSRSGKTCKHQS